MYSISKYTKDKADELGLKLFPSQNPKKKLEVYNKVSGNFMGYIGGGGFFDYEMYLKAYGKEYADERRRLYYTRHSKDISRVGSKGWLSWVLLWRG
jgi:hypothetical protein